MNNIDLSKTDNVAIAPDSIILKFSLLGCVGLALIGLGIFTVNNHQNAVKSQQQATGKTNKIQTSTKPSEPPLIVTKKPNKPVVIEEGSKAYYCIKNNGGSGCLTRDRFAPNYQIVSPPKRVKTYEDYLVQYGVRESGGCDRYFNGEPNC
ncbi:hypothetical protein [Planktothrix agardhii]|uniref:hypothetical protein n=1 Tax=Planktothrix agardhii TaxID=1160 RepID=UPI001D0AD3F5|nr:hypothetical protein [Planktothrix agardhii]MCB8762202.1 hypothetical protein [Planktothrix agardhii 1813]